MGGQCRRQEGSEPQPPLPFVRCLGRHLGPPGPHHQKHPAHRRCGQMSGLVQGAAELAVWEGRSEDELDSSFWAAVMFSQVFTPEGTEFQEESRAESPLGPGIEAVLTVLTNPSSQQLAGKHSSVLLHTHPHTGHRARGISQRPVNSLHTPVPWLCHCCPETRPPPHLVWLSGPGSTRRRGPLYCGDSAQAGGDHSLGLSLKVDFSPYKMLRLINNLLSPHLSVTQMLRSKPNLTFQS